MRALKLTLGLLQGHSEPGETTGTSTQAQAPSPAVPHQPTGLAATRTREDAASHRARGTVTPRPKGQPAGVGEGLWGEQDPHLPPRPQGQAFHGAFPDARTALLSWADGSPGAGVLSRTHRLHSAAGLDPRLTKGAEPVSESNPRT